MREYDARQSMKRDLSNALSLGRVVKNQTGWDARAGLKQYPGKTGEYV